ncbi:MAG TPA: DUF4012 domain-containing protein [Ktedonobacterales bacterium]|nr:DUF4012 domain-containing protein [Ktedonobacterales bacterium]
MTRSSSFDNGVNGQGGSRGRNGFRQFGDRVREFTGQMPLVRRVTGHRAQRRVNQGWNEWDERVNAAPHDGYGGDYGEANGFRDDLPETPPIGDDFGMPGESGGASSSARGGRGASKGSARHGRLRDRSISMKLVTVLALLSVIVGFCCTQSTLSVLDFASAAIDARAQVTAIEGILKGGNATSTDRLTELQGRMTSLNVDLLRIQAMMPGPFVQTSTGANLDQTLTMAVHLVQAGRYGVDAALILVPHLKAAFSAVGGGAAGAPPPVPTATSGPSPAATATPTPIPASVLAGGLTMDDITRAQQDITSAGMLAQQALAERQQINEKQLSSVGLGSVISILHKMDGIAPKLPTYLGYANTVMAALPDLLGITKPAHFLLFNVDSDELRSTGGFMGNIAPITVIGGKLIGGVKLRDILTIDCPRGPNFCPKNLIPAQFSWMNSDPTQFGVRDSNLSPDFPTSAHYIEQLYQQETGQSVDGMIMITPEIIKDMLKVTGPLSIEGFNQKVDPSNLQDIIHYSHIQSRNKVAGGDSQTKAIDGLLGSALLKKVAALSGSKQSELFKSILAGFDTKDIQIYMNDPQIESLLTTFHVDSTIPMPPGMDGLMVTDVNTGATYFSRDLQESVADTIRFDSMGNAIHDMTITYHLPIVQHLWTPIYVWSPGSGQSLAPITWYTGVSRVIVPPTAQPVNGTGTWLPDGTLSAMEIDQCNTPFQPSCVVIPAPEPNHAVWALRINTMQVGGEDIILHMHWTVPNVLKSVNGTLQYNLHLYRQASSHVSYDIKIIPPGKYKIAQPLAAPFTTPKGTTAGNVAEFTNPLLIKDMMLTLTFTRS